MTAPVVNYELCEQCEKNMNTALEEAGLFGGTVEEMIETQAQIPFALAIELADEGYLIKRVGEENAFTLETAYVNPMNKDEGTRVIAVKDADGKTISHRHSFSVSETLAEDYIVIGEGAQVEGTSSI